jgi:hypothetical protein
VPRSHYRHGYAVSVSGANVTSEPGARYLELRRTRRAHKVSLTLSP